MLRLVAVLCAAVFAVSTSGASASTVRVRLGDRVVFSGRTGSTPGSGSGARATGRVFVTATWNGHARYVVATPLTDTAGRFTVRFKPTRRGTYDVRVLTPDRAVTEYTVYVT